MKLHAPVEMENISARIGNLPAFSQSRLDVQVSIACKKIIEDQIVNPFRLRVEPDARI